MQKNMKQNLTFALIVLLLAGILFTWRSLKNQQNQEKGLPLQAELIYGDKGTRLTIPLEGNHRVDLDTGYYTIHIQIQDGAARFVDSPCPDHICENFGWISMEDQTATCLPARAVLAIVPKS